MHSYHADNPTPVSVIDIRMKEPTLWESFCVYLQKRGYAVQMPERVHERGLLYESSPEIQDILVSIMKGDPETALLSELLVDFDEGLQEWRYRHVKMVERTIGTKKGTGGSDGVQYLRKTLEYKVFPDLWEIRTRF
jgi:tryptophan 2,3-dioxygenase